MPSWSNTPPTEASKPGFPLLRVPRGTRTTYLCTADDLVGCYTHFWGGRTVPCEDNDCKACHEGIPARWHAYLSVLEAGTLRHSLLETTAGPALTLCEYRNTYRTLRGCRILAYRTGSGINGRINFHCTPADLSKVAMPPAPDVLRLLATVWRLKVPEINITTATQTRRRPTNADAAQQQITQPDPLTISQLAEALASQYSI